MRRAAATVAVLLLGASVARAQPPVPLDPASLQGDSPQTRKRLAEAEQKVLGGKAPDAIEDLQRILDEAGDDLITVDGKQFRPARWVAHQILAKLPPNTLKAYQGRIEEPARKLLDAGKRDRDPRPLWQLLDRFFVSRPAEEALLLLGDLLFERGEFRTAELLWRRLVPEVNPDIPYPSPKTDAVAVRARVILAAIFQGDLDRAKAELADLKAKHPNAAGSIAGKTGPFAETLQPLLERPPQLPPAAAGDASWPAFAGGPGRTGRVAGRMAVHWPRQPTWLTTLPTPTPGRAPFGHPVVVDGRVYVGDGSRVFTCDLFTGNPLTGKMSPLPGAAAAGSQSDPCSVLTAAGGRLYARGGPAVLRPLEPAAAGGAAEESGLVCYGLFGQPRRTGPSLTELWRVKPPSAEARVPVVWEGAPLVADGRMWAAFARLEGGRVVHAVAGYDPADTGTAPDRPAWVAELGDSQLPPTSPGTEARTRHELLTIAGRNVVFGSNAGLVVALNAVTGRRAWAFKYPRTGKRPADAARAAEPAPAVAVGGRVFVAPTDADRVYALDAETGRILWESGPTEGAQILGVTRGRLVVTVAGPLRSLRGLSVRTGSYVEPEGWVQSDGGGLPSYGRGFVTDDLVVWPSRVGLWFLDAETGSPRRSAMLTMLPPPQEGQFGNVAYADGVLVVVTPTAVWGYVSEEKRFGSVPRAGIEPERVQFEKLIDEAERRLADDDPRGARETLVRVAGGDLPARFRAWAAARLLILGPAVDGGAKLPPDVRELMRPELRGEWLVTAKGELLTLDALIARHTGRAATPNHPPPFVTLPARPSRAAPGRAADAAIDRTVRLPPAAVPLRPIMGACGPPGHVFAAAGTDLLAVALEGGAIVQHVAPEAFTHAADLGEGFVAAGPFAVALYGSGRKPEWVFRVPDTDPLPARPGALAIRTDEVAPIPALSSFVLSGSWLFARLGERHLIAFDLKARRVVWVLGAHGQPRIEPIGFPNSPRFGPHLFVSGRLIAAQLSDGRRWTIRAETGRVWDGNGGTFEGTVPPGFGDSTAPVPWAGLPVEVDPNRIAFSDGPGLVRLHNLTTRRVKWAYGAGGESSLTGEPPQVRMWDDAVLVAVRRNHGVEIDRIELTDGKSVWTGGPIFLDADRANLAAADADARRLYVPFADKLGAFALTTGKPVWEAELPDTHGAGGWVVRAGRKVVIAYPENAIPCEPVAGVWERVSSSFLRRPRAWRLPWLAGTLYDAWVERTVPVLLFDPESGKLLKTVEISARGPVVTAYFDDDLTVIATGDRVVWIR